MSRLDFSKIARRSTSDSATEPRRIFSALPSKDAKYGYARDVQSEVWQAWHERRDTRDLIIKMNTGGGKTVVGLLMLKSSLNEHIGPAAYITPDIYLAGQVQTEANGLGLETTDDPESPRFRQGHAILITNIYKLFNGLSVFGVSGSPRPITELGSVLVDDAHACLATVQDQFTLCLPSDHSAYEPVLKLFAPDLRAQSEPGFRDIRDQDISATLPIPFWAWADKQKELLSILHPYRNSDDMKFVWPLIADTLSICRAVASANSIEIAPPCPPVEMIPSFGRAKRRLYLTATLSDDSILVTHFGAEPDSVHIPITPRSADDLGDRMILTPLQTYSHINEERIREFAADQARSHNVVVIVPSWARAEVWRPFARGVYGSRTLQDGLALLRKGHVGLVVLVNKYDGIDLPGEACRVLVLDGLPEALGALDRLETVALEGSDTLLTRQIQRIEQGMGRGVRSNDDYCVVLLLGKRLAARLYSPAARDRFSPATRAQLELSDEIARLLQSKQFEALSDVIDQCLQRDPDWVAASRDALDGLEYARESKISETAIAERDSFELARQQRYVEAAGRLQVAIDATKERLVRGLLKQQSAAYLHHADPIRAQRLQRSALADNRMIVKPRKAVSYTSLREPGEQASAASGYLSNHYSNSQELVLGIEALLEQLIPSQEPVSVPSFEQSMSDLGCHLGFGSQRPEREVGRGPDVLWLLGKLSYLVIECKSASAVDRISRSDAAQLSHSMDWFAETYDPTCLATPVLVHPGYLLDSKASAREGMRIISFKKLSDLRDAMNTFATSVAIDDQYRDPAAVADRLKILNLTGAGFIERWSRRPSTAR